MAGNAFAVTDNAGVDEPSGETFVWRLDRLRGGGRRVDHRPAGARERWRRGELELAPAIS